MKSIRVALARLSVIAHRGVIVVSKTLKIFISQNLRPFLKKTVKQTKRTAKFLHHHAAKRPHQHLCNKWSWYDRWHKHTQHNKVHLIVASGWAIFIFSLVFAQYGRVHALSNLMDSWDFSNSGDYIVSSAANVGDSKAKLSEQEYASDANTVALFHFNEASGPTITDSSGLNNNGVAANVSFTTGVLNNSLTLNGGTSQVSVPNSSSLQLVRDNSLEAWTKFNSSFDNASNSQRQGIFDKGDYQLYFDNETGKVVYELADKSANTWTLNAGDGSNKSWNNNGIRSANAIVKMGSNYYYGVGLDTGDAEVWMWNGTTWTQIGGGANSINNSWAANTYEGVYSLATDGTNIYAGLGLNSDEAEVWMWNGTTWTKIADRDLNGAWGAGIDQVLSLDFMGGNLYAGTGISASDAKVWKWNGASWAQIGGVGVAGGGWGAGYEIVSTLTNDGTNLYAGLGTSTGDGEVWKWNGSSWSQIGGDDINSGWSTNIETVRSLKYFGGKLYAGLGDGSDEAEVWVFSGGSWTKIGDTGLNGGWGSGTSRVDSLAWDGTNLYAGLGYGGGRGDVWKWNGSSWSQVGGDSINGSWSSNEGFDVASLLYGDGKLYVGTMDNDGSGFAYTLQGSTWSRIGGNNINYSWGFYNLNSVQVMQAQGGYLYAGLGGTTGAAPVYQFDGTSWKLIGGQGINNSWAPDTYEQVLSMASYKGNLYVGLGNSTNDAEVWKWDGTSWTQIGGDAVNSSWNTRYEEVDSMAVANGYLYAGLGSGNGDGVVWRYDGSQWDKIGGDSLNGGWTTGIDNVFSMAIFNNKLVVGTGRNTNEGIVWQWDGSSWTQIGGNSVNSSWGPAEAIESVQSLAPYNGKLYAGLGDNAGDADLWEFNGTAWTQVGGDGINSSWVGSKYEKVKSITVYDGALFVGLGNSTGDGDVWRYSDGNWTRLAGDSINNGWASNIEEVDSFSTYKGKLFVGTGLSYLSDANVWTWGNNGYLESNKSSFDNGWHHVSASYDGATMKLNIDGQAEGQTSANLLMPSSNRDLLIGQTYGGREFGKAVGTFNGQIDEARVSNIARTSFITKPYPTTAQTVQPKDAIRKSGVWHWDSFDTTESGGTITYRLSDDGGTSWKYWDGSAWVTSSGIGQTNPASVVSAQISSFPVTFKGLLWQATLQGDGSQQVSLSNVTVQATSDVTQPDSNASNLSALKAAGGSVLTAGSWTNGSSPYISWDNGTDAESGVKGYCIYLGTDSTADPVSTKGLLGTNGEDTGGNCQFMTTTASVNLATAGYIATPMVSSNNKYYFIVKTIDNAGNVSTDSASFNFKFDNTPPTNPDFISAPSGFVSDKAVTLSWATTGAAAPNDANSGLAGLQYRIGSGGTWYGSSHIGDGSQNDLLPNSGSYTMVDPPDFDNLADGINTVYFRAYDEAGNISQGTTTAAIKLNTTGAPSEPLDVVASPSTSSTNAFNFQWHPPATFVGSANNVTYCYTVNVLPDASNCTYTGNGITSLATGPYATKYGVNVLYLVAKDESGKINYANYASTNFTANTIAPGIPISVDVIDVSVRSAHNWRLALTWEAPTNAGSGVASYSVYRSTNNTNFSLVGSSSSTTFIDAGLQQIKYYYHIIACDNTNNCSAASTSVNALPTGRYTEPATMIAQPEATNITTKKADISWSTNRTSDSRIAIGTTSGHYGSSEIANSAQVSDHQVSLDNLAAGTTYYYVAKWTDEDGNIGTSQEFTFRTAPPPTLKEVAAVNVGLSTATIQFTSKNANKVNVYYGPSESLGGAKSINTSFAESTYTVNLDGLSDGTKYFFKLVSYDTENNSYESSVQSFTTPARPHIKNLTFQPVPGQPTSTQKVSWQTNVPSSTSVMYGIVGTNGSEAQQSESVTDHSIIISDLADDSEYFLVAQSRDGNGNLATSDRQVFRTALDTRPPVISNVTIESSIRGSGAEARGQVVVSWRTDELATSQVAYAEGSGATVFNSKTSEDGALSFEHIMIVSDLPPSRVYTIQPVSHDKSRNEGVGKPQTAIIGRASDSVLTIVLNTLKGIFGF